MTKRSENQTIVIVLVAILVTCVVAYRLLVSQHLEQTAALFIGLPAVLAIGLSFLPPSKSLMGSMIKGITLALLLSGILFQEGLVCILFAAPLFYLVGAILVGLASLMRDKNTARSFTAVMFLPLAMEGVLHETSFNREESVIVKKVFQLTPAQVEKGLARTSLSHSLPAFLRIGFPLPGPIQGSGLRLGDRRRIHFSGGEGNPGDLDLEVTQRDNHSVTFTALKDTSHIAHWLNWRTSKVSWKKVSSGQVEVTWEISYERLLDPAWYFAPSQKYAVKLAAEYLVDSIGESGR